MQYGCLNGNTCSLSSEEYNFMAQDELYCTSSVISCNIHCDSPNSCRSLIIYSSAQSTNIICNGNFSCHNTTIRIGDTSIYPLTFKSKHFSNINPTKSNVNCEAPQSCSSLKMYFDGTKQDEMTVLCTNTNAFYDGYFDCNININNNEYNEYDDNSTNGCNLYCSNTYTNECLHATLDCNFADDTYCQCNGDGCNIQSVDILYDNSTIKTIATTSSTRVIMSHIDESFFESKIFKYIIIIIVILAICLGCCLIICCWKFETFYDYFEHDKYKAPKSLNKTKHAPAQSHSELNQYNQYNQHHSKQNSQTVSRSQSGGNTNNETDTTITTVTGKHIELASNTNKNNNQTVIGMDTARERMPSSWYKYKQQKHSSTIPTINNNTQHIQNTQEQKPMKQNKNPKKSGKMNKMREYKKVNIKEQKSKYDDTNNRNNESESDPLSTGSVSTDDSDSDTDTDTDTSSTDSDSDSDTESQDGDNADETKQTVNGVNIDDMMVNMVMLIQKTPVDLTPNDKNSNVQMQFPNTTKANLKTNV